MRGNMHTRLERLETATGTGKARICSVWFVDSQEKAHTPGPDDAKTRALWGSGPDTWRIHVKPGQSKDDALRQAGIDPDKDNVLNWGTA